MAKGQKGQIVTKKHLARQERERRQTRIILIISIAVIVIVVGLISYGVIQQYIILPNQPVAKVANNNVTTKQFQTFARYQRLQVINQYNYYSSIFGGDASSLSYLEQQFNAQLEPLTLGQNVIDFLVDNEIIKIEAEKLGIDVTDAEVEEQIQSNFGFFPNGTPTTAPTTEIRPTSTLNPTQIALVPPTSTATPTATITPSPVITGTQEITSSISTPVIEPTVIVSATAVLTPTPPAITSTPFPTSTPYTLEGFKKEFKTYTENTSKYADFSAGDFRWVTGMLLLRQKVYENITNNISQEQDQVWARHIVVSDEAQAQTIYDRLASGEDFETVATEVYSGTGNTADLGWFGLGTLEDSNAEKEVFNMQIGQISEPIQTGSGWEIYQVLGHEVRQLSDSEFEQLKQKEFRKWLDQQISTADVQQFEIWKTRVPTRPTIPPTQPSQ